MNGALVSVLLVLVVATATVSAVSSGSEGSLGIGRESYSDLGVQYSYPIANNDSLHVVFPDLKFNCHGYVSNWSALTVLDSRFISALTLSLQMQLWRPTSANPDVYTYVGEEALLRAHEPRGSDLRDIPGEESTILKLYEFQQETDLDDSRLSFQPGDIVGFRVHFSNSLVPASVTFRNATPAEASSPIGKVTRMYIVPAENDQQLLEVSQSSSETVIHEAVVPQLLVNYVVEQTVITSSHSLSPSISPSPTSSSSFSSPTTFSTVVEQTVVTSSSSLSPSVSSSPTSSSSSSSSSSPSRKYRLLLIESITSLIVVLLSFAG